MSKRILVIDDAPAILELLRIVLEREGYEVHAWKQAYRNVEEVARLQPHLIILDFQLGKGQKNGWQQAQVLKSHAPTASIPVIICTAAAREVEAYRNEFQTHHIPLILKPFLLKDVLRTVRQLLESNAANIPQFALMPGSLSQDFLGPVGDTA